MRKGKLFIFGLISILCFVGGCSNNENSNSSTSSEQSSTQATDTGSQTSEVVTTYNVNLPQLEGCTITTEKEKYSAGEIVRLNIVLEEKYYVVEGSLKFNDTLIDDSLEFVMPEKDVNITCLVKKDNKPDNQIYGAHIFSNQSAQWNMALVNIPNVPLTNVSGLIVEIQFHKQINNLWFRLACGTNDGTIYDAFGKSGIGEPWYSCDMDQPNAVDQYVWHTSEWGGWVPSWNEVYDSIPPVFFVEVPLQFFYARFNVMGHPELADNSYLTNSKILSQLGIHITGETSEVDFTIGRLFVRDNGIVKQIASPVNYTIENKEGKNKVNTFKIDPFGTYSSPLLIEIFDRYKEHNKKMLMLGDSIMTRWWSNGEVNRIANEFDCNLVRDTIGGTTIAATNGEVRDDSLIYQLDNKLFDKYFEQLDTFDYIVIQRGTNDLWQIANNKYQLGDALSTDRTTLMGAIRELLNYFKEKAPNAKIVMSSLLYRYDSVSDEAVREYNSLLKEVIDDIGGVNFFDLYNKSGINSTNYSQYLNSSTCPHHNGDSPDNLHPNDAGAVMIGNAWIDFLHSLDD